MTLECGVLTLTSFQDHFNFTQGQKTHVSSLCVSLQQLGAFVACPLSIPLSRKYGRKSSIFVGSVVFCIGAMMQTIPSHSLACFYVGRVIAGLGLGAMTVVVPQYNAEMSPKEIRGRLGSFFQMAFTLGIFTSYWVDYGVKVNMDSTDSQWQIPVGLQILFSGLLALGMITVKESPRWLITKDRLEEAKANLEWVRASDGPEVASELSEISVAVRAEHAATEGLRWTEFFQPSVFRRLSAAFALFMAQQATGATAFAYYSPQYFNLLTGNDETRSLLLSGIFGAVKVIACFAFVCLAADRFTRKFNLASGAFAMAATQIVTAAVLKHKPIDDSAAADVPPAAKATVAMIYLFVMIYNFSWGPLPWPYCSELFSNRYREVGVAVGVSSQWLFNFVFTISTPYMIDSMGWGTFLLWGLFDIIIGFGTIVLAKETRGLSLEKTGQPKGFRDDNEAKPGNVYRRPSSSSIGSDNKNPARVKDTDI
ncbi:putative quinate permease [Lasiodiplodia hormozganensis]|uniref:Quinate permease n=1 Tax=Lasiodiplodia hormozganensis TaxID=869390 RepID=A0AA39YLM9_9PEZI|nr:putative quinate permease [Lasiodiplodia hormozganensis]